MNIVVFEGQHSYASYILNQQHRKIFSNNNRILKQEYFIKSYPPFKNEIELGDSFYDECPAIQDISYMELLHKGAMVAVKRVEGRLAYFICPFSRRESEVGQIPDKHRAEYDVANNRARLIGLSALRGWCYLKREQQSQDYSVMDTARSIMSQKAPFFVENIMEKIEIPERILGISLESKEIVCLADTRDSQHIGLQGGIGSGKTMFASRIVDENYWKNGNACIIANDTKPETQGYCMPWTEKENPSFVKQLRKLGEIPRSLPLVYLTPKTRTSEDYIFYKDEVGFETSIDSRFLLINMEKFLKGSKNWTISKRASGLALRSLIFNDNLEVREDGLLQAFKEAGEKKDFGEIESFICTLFPSKRTMGMRDSILRFLRDIWNFNILDVTNGIESTWEVEFPEKNKKKYYPWSSCLVCNLIPSIITADLKMYPFYPLVYRFILEDCWKLKQNEPSLKNKELTVWTDELPELTKDEGTREVIESSMKLGRSRGVQFIWGAQYDSDVPPPIQEVTNYHFYFNQSERKQVTNIMKRCDLPSYRERHLRHLKTFECIATTKLGAELVLYNEKGERRVIGGENEKESIKMRIFPSLCYHTPTKKMVENV